MKNVKMNILFLNHNVEWQGGFFRAYHWGRYLVEMGHDVSIITISKSNKFKFSSSLKDGVKIIKSPDLLKGKYRTGWDLWDTIRRIFYILNKNYEIVHCVDTRPNVVLPGIIYKVVRGCTLVMDWGDWWGRGGTIYERSNSLAERLFAPVETFFEERFRKYADGNIVLSNVLKKRAISLGVEKSSLVTIRHGADVNSIYPMNIEASRSKLKFDNNIILLGYLGTIFPKDAEILLESFLIALNKNPNIKLLLIGNCNITVPDYLIDNSDVIKTGRLDFDIMLEYISSCDFMLLPLKDTIANRGRWPSKVCDYLAAGRPVIATETGDISKLFSDGKAGYLSKDNSEDFAGAILLGIEENRQNEMGLSARKVAEEIISWKNVTEQLMRFYLSTSK